MSKLAGKSITLVGGSGYTGRAITKAAIRLGIQVNSISRKIQTPPINNLHKQFSLDITSEKNDNELKEIFQTSDAVIHLIGTLFESKGAVINGPGSYELLNRESAKKTTDLLSQCKNPKLIYLSAHKNFPFFPRYLSTKREAEDYIRQSKGLKSVILRPGLIVAPEQRAITGPLSVLIKGVDTFYSPLVSMMKDSKVKCVLSQLNYNKSISLDILAQATISAAVFKEYNGRQ